MSTKTATHDNEKSSAAVRKRHGASTTLRQTKQINPADAPAFALNANERLLAVADILALQRTAGNRAVEQILAQTIQHHQQSRLTIQAKLAVGAPDDPYEREADRVAASVVQTIQQPVAHIQRQRSPEDDEETMVQAKPVASSITSVIQREAMPAKEDEEETLIQRRGIGALASVDPAIERGIEAARGGGQSLPGDLRIRMEQSFGADFSRVRVHADADSDRLNSSLQSRAFTTGYDLYFKRGEYNFTSSEGQRLIAHELAHVVQQNKPAGVTELRPPEKAQSRDVSVSRNVIQRCGTDSKEATAPKPKPKPYDAEPKHIEKIRVFLAKDENKLAKTMLGGLFKKYEESWLILKLLLVLGPSLRKKETSSFDEAKKEFLDAAKNVHGIDAVSTALEAKFTEVRARLDPHKTIENHLDLLSFGGKASWLLSYSADKKDEIKAKHGPVKIVVTREQREFDKLKAAKEGLEKIVKPYESSVAESMAAARTATSEATAITEMETKHFTDGEKLTKDLDTVADTAIDNIIRGAMAKEREYLDILDNQVVGIKNLWKEKRVHKNAAEKQITDAAKVQHEPVRDPWFGKLGLVRKAERYNYVESGRIGGDPVHETLYHDQFAATNIVTPQLAALKDQVLGSGTDAYHVTLETTDDSTQNSHVYRGAEIIRYEPYRQKYSDEKGVLKQNALGEDAFTTRLRAKRDVCVTRVEASVKDAQDNKGRGMMTAEVKNKLERV